MEFQVVRSHESSYSTEAMMFDLQTKTGVAVIQERPWVDKNNDGVRDPNVCRINSGRYSFIRAMSPKRHVPVWWGCGIPNVTPAPDIVQKVFDDLLRTLPADVVAAIGEARPTTSQIHWGSFPWDLEGCLGIGTAFEPQVLYDHDSVVDPDDNRHTREKGKFYRGITGSKAKFEWFMELTKDEQVIWLNIVDNFGAPHGTWA